MADTGHDKGGELLPDELLLKIERLGSRVLPQGPWKVVTDYPALAIACGDHRVVQTANQNNYRRFGPSERWMGIEYESVAEYIAACAPATIRSLVSELTRLRALLADKDAAPSDAQIKHMVSRFLGWKLPDDFHPDGGISFKSEFNEHTAHPMKAEPIGTNLLTAIQAEAMVRHMLEGLPQGSGGQS